MKGKKVFFPAGIDRNGLSIEYRAEREYNINMQDTSRERFLKLCRRTLDTYETEIIEILTRMGISFNSLSPEDYYRTDSQNYRCITQATFIRLWNQNMIYEANRPNNWCTRCGTTLADAEIEYEEKPTELFYLKFKIQETNQDLVIATTRPELLGACKIILVPPQDDRYEDLHHKTAITPWYEKEVPIIPKEEVKKEFGTGAMMICSYGDYEDVRLCRKLKIKPTKLITPEGRLSDAAGKYAEMSVKEARETIVQDLEAQELLTKRETILHKIPVCGRCGTPIEFVPMREYYLKQLEFLDEVLQIAQNLQFYPEEKRKILLNWIDSITIDWPISRRRFYGTEIPLWYCKAHHHPILPEPGDYYQPWKEDPPIEACPQCGCEEFIPETRTFDTWMDSSLTPLYVAKYLQDEEFFKQHYPLNLRPQCTDIIRTWLYYTILKAVQLTEKKPFEKVWIGNLVMDEHGKTMSKSRGNVIPPTPLLEKYGADALRIFAAGAAKPGENIKINEDQIDGAAKFLQKLWNIARFVSMFPIPRKSEIQLKPVDKWILTELYTLSEKVLDSYDNYNFYITNEIRNFTWNTFARHYLELVKARSYKTFGTEAEQKACWWTLHVVLKHLLKILSPIAIFMTDYIYETLYGKEIHLSKFPQLPPYTHRLKEITDTLKRVNSTIWKWKKGKKRSLNDPFETLQIPRILKPLKADLQALHRVKHIFIGDTLRIDGETVRDS